MGMNENVPGTSAPVDRAIKPSRSNLHPLHEAALRLADVGLGKSRTKTRDLVALLLAHGARAWRTGQPAVDLHLHVRTPGGRHPVRLRLR